MGKVIRNASSDDSKTVEKAIMKYIGIYDFKISPFLLIFVCDW